ncbi:hypothetical protein FACS1894154_04810 [Betaproteobacteria bacterium]|nr:hypothetical protein FACS1894154_04810 [Betaproteobacteria bacterium]GHU24244.1 hypothetical protein FACS189488_08500 [Betaproteobacteria bacterium]
MNKYLVGGLIAIIAAIAVYIFVDYRFYAHESVETQAIKKQGSGSRYISICASEINSHIRASGGGYPRPRSVTPDSSWDIDPGVNQELTTVIFSSGGADPKPLAYCKIHKRSLLVEEVVYNYGI